MTDPDDERDRVEAHPDITVQTGTEVAALHGGDLLDGITLATGTA